MTVRNARSSLFAYLKTVLSIKENGSRSTELPRRMGVEFKYGQMAQDMMGSGRITKQMEEADLFMTTEITIMEIGKMERTTVLESIRVWNKTDTKANGNTTKCMAMVEKHGLTDLLMRDNFTTV